MLKNALKILELLDSNGYLAYIVGGYPRDKYLNIESFDIDICTSATPVELIEIFNNDIIGSPTYASLRLKKENYIYQITTFRKDGLYLDVRHPSKIEYTKSLYEDLLRRDFIINTLCINVNGEYIDLLNAKKDIKNKIIKTVGNADYKIKSDILRLLRAIRFACILNFKLDKKLEQAIIKNKKLLVNLSYDRKKQELDKIFKSNNKKIGIDLILKYQLDEFLDIKGLKNIIITDNYLGIWAQLECDNYNFTRYEKRNIKIIRKLVSELKFDQSITDLYGIEIFNTVKQIIAKNTRK